MFGILLTIQYSCTGSLILCKQSLIQMQKPSGINFCLVFVAGFAYCHLHFPEFGALREHQFQKRIFGRNTQLPRPVTLCLKWKSSFTLSLLLQLLAPGTFLSFVEAYFYIQMNFCMSFLMFLKMNITRDQFGQLDWM